MFLEFRIQAYLNGRSSIGATHSNGGFTRRAEELDVRCGCIAQGQFLFIRSLFTANREFRGNIGDCRVAFVDVFYQLLVIHAVLNGRAVSCYGKSLIFFHVKCNFIIRVIDRFAFFLFARI